MPTWTERTTAYLDQLAELVDQIDGHLQQTRIDPGAEAPGTVSVTTERLRQALGDLERVVAGRQNLLVADDAPEAGDTIAKKLTSLGEPELADRCSQLGTRIADVHHQAVSVFVCQYHLADLTTDLVRLMTGATEPATYGGDDNQPVSTPGGLFNEAA